MLEGW